MTADNNMYYPLPEDKKEEYIEPEKKESSAMKFGRTAINNMVVGDVIPNFGTVIEICDKHIILKEGMKKKKYKFGSADMNSLTYIVGGLISMAVHLSGSQIGNCLEAFERDENSENVDGVVRLKDG